jgi:hypothetical protein
LDDGKIYRKALYLMAKSMVSCRFSLKPIQCYQSSLKITNQQAAGFSEVMHPFWSFRCQLSPFEVCQDLRIDLPLQLDGDVFQRYEYVYTY